MVTLPSWWLGGLVGGLKIRRCLVSKGFNTVSPLDDFTEDRMGLEWNCQYEPGSTDPDTVFLILGRSV